MPTFADSKLPRPTAWSEFQRIVMSALKIRWCTAEVTQVGRNGQAQDGVDLHGEDRAGRQLGAQCRLKDKSRLRVAEIEKAIVEAEQFTPPLDEYYVVTTEDHDAGLQEQVRLLSRAHRRGGKFGVHVLFWDDVVQDLATDERELLKHYPQLVPRGADAPRYNGLTFEQMIDLLRAERVDVPEALAPAPDARRSDLLALYVGAQAFFERGLMPMVNSPVDEFLYPLAARLVRFGLVEAVAREHGFMGQILPPLYRTTATGRAFLLRMASERAELSPPSQSGTSSGGVADGDRRPVR